MPSVLPEKEVVICIAGFGDNGSLFSPLQQTAMADHYHIIPLNLPGFGDPTTLAETTLENLADFVVDHACEHNSTTLIAHSVASIIASLAAEKASGQITRIISLEGNLTAADAYFSGTAADFDDPIEFHHAFCARLADMGQNDPSMERYRSIVANVNPMALWQLGCDAHAFSQRFVPGERLMGSADVTYLYNPDNCAAESLEWLEVHPIKRKVLNGASHSPTIDQPNKTAAAILGALER